MTPRRTTTMRIDDELLDGLQALKDRDGAPVSEQVRRAIHAWLKAKGISIAKAERPRAGTRKRSVEQAIGERLDGSPLPEEPPDTRNPAAVSLSKLEAAKGEARAKNLSAAKRKDIAKKAAKSVDEYMSSQPDNAHRMLKRVRGAIRRAVPSADEMISYGLPTYKLHGRPVIYFAGWKEHYSIYPSTDRLVAAFKDELARYQVSKGTIRFPFSESVPTQLIHRIARIRLKEVTERKTKATGNKQ